MFNLRKGSRAAGRFIDLMTGDRLGERGEFGWGKRVTRGMEIDFLYMVTAQANDCMASVGGECDEGIANVGAATDDHSRWRGERDDRRDGCRIDKIPGAELENVVGDEGYGDGHGDRGVRVEIK